LSETLSQGEALPHMSSNQATTLSGHANPVAVRAGLGHHVFGLGIFALGLAIFVWGDFVSGQSVPNDFPHRTALAYTVAAFLLIVGAALQFRRSAAISAAALTAYYTLIVILLMNGRLFLAHFAEYGTYENLAIQLAIPAAALIVYATYAEISPALATRLTSLGQLAFGFCALVWGGAHFIYMNLTAPLVPRWLPPSQVFWGYLTGVAFLAAGLAILSRIQARLAAILLTLMLAAFTFFVHIRILLSDHHIEFNWTELALNVTLLGAAWIIADSFSRPTLQTADAKRSPPA
jgi:hypothetical protein